MNNFWKSSKLTILLSFVFVIILLFIVKREIASLENYKQLKLGYIENWEEIFDGPRDIGTKSYPLQLIIFYDYECPYCSSFEESIKSALKEFKNKLAVTYQHRLLPNHERALSAAIAAECAGLQNKFLPFHELLFERTLDIYNVNFQEIAKESGVRNLEKFSSCMEEMKTLKVIDREVSRADSLGINETPYFLINGSRFKSAIDSSTLNHLLSQELKSKRDDQ